MDVIYDTFAATIRFEIALCNLEIGEKIWIVKDALRQLCITDELNKDTKEELACYLKECVEELQP